MAINWKNPIIFGVVVGLVLCLFLFLHDKLFRKKEERSGFSGYLKLFIAGFLSSGGMAWLFFNRNLSFSTSGAIEGSVTGTGTASITLSGCPIFIFSFLYCTPNRSLYSLSEI